MRVDEHVTVYFLSIEFFLFQLYVNLDSENEIKIIRIWLTMNLLIHPLPINRQRTIHTQLLTINPRSSINHTIDIRSDTFALTSPLGVLSIKSTVVERSIKKSLIKGDFKVVNVEYAILILILGCTFLHPTKMTRRFYRLNKTNLNSSCLLVRYLYVL